MTKPSGVQAARQARLPGEGTWDLAFRDLPGGDAERMMGRDAGREWKPLLGSGVPWALCPFTVHSPTRGVIVRLCLGWTSAELQTPVWRGQEAIALGKSGGDNGGSSPAEHTHTHGCAHIQARACPGTYAHTVRHACMGPVMEGTSASPQIPVLKRRFPLWWHWQWGPSEVLRFR